MSYPKLKYCGNRSFGDFRITAASRADFIGVIFAKESKRQVDAHDVSLWLKKVQLEEKKLVGVFVNPTVNDILEVLVKIKLDIIQLHGHESTQHMLHIKETIPHIPLWKVIHHSEGGYKTMKSFNGVADSYIIDTKKGKQLGGTGKVFDWSYVPEYVQEAHRQGVPCFIAGGIKPENITQLLRYHPDGIDLSSGIEKNDQKSIDLIHALEQRVDEFND